MTRAEELYHSIADNIPDTKKGKMFGALCLKAPNGKAGVMFWKDYLVFKLNDKDQAATLKLAGAKIFEPMEGKQMNGWVQLSYDHAKKWKDLSEKAMTYVKTIEKK